MSARQYRMANAWLAIALLMMLAAPRLLSVSPDGARLLLPGGGVLPELCLTKRTTGRECSSCHLGRSVVLASHGNFAQSFEQHAGGVVLVAWLGLQALVRIILVFAFARLARLWWVALSVTLATLAAAASVAAML